jgi:hypothetical protein
VTPSGGNLHRYVLDTPTHRRPIGGPHAPQVDGVPYEIPIENHDEAVLRCLRRLGCPWGTWDHFSARDLFSYAVRHKCSLELLSWLRIERCPVDWEEASRIAEARKDAGAAAVRALIALWKP